MTTTKVNTIADVASSGNLNELAEVAKKVSLGTMLQPVKLVKTGLTSATSFDLTSVALGSNPPVGAVVQLRVTAGTATGVRSITDAGDTATTAKALLSDDGKTITFEAAITAFIMTYMPRAAVDMTTKFTS